MRVQQAVQRIEEALASPTGQSERRQVPPGQEDPAATFERRRPPRWFVAGVAAVTLLVGGALGALWWPADPAVERDVAAPSALPKSGAAPPRLDAGGLDPAGLAAARPLGAARPTSAAEGESVPITTPLADQSAGERERLDISEPARTPSTPALSVSAPEREAMARRLALQDERIRLMTEALRASRERIAPMEETLSSATAALATATQRIEALDARLSAHAEAQAAARRAAVAPPAPKPTPRLPALPFEVLSIDLWGERVQVTVAFDDGAYFLGVGDSQGGWIVEAIDRGTHTVVFRTRGGATRTVHVTG
jgi:hypothetical protein